MDRSAGEGFGRARVSRLAPLLAAPCTLPAGSPSPEEVVVMVSRATLFAAVAAVAALVACADDGGPDAPIDQDGTVGGRVLLSLDGPLVGATVTVDHLEYLGQTIAVRSRVAELTTDADGHFSTATGQLSGYFRITTRGGAFRDYASGDLVVLDDADGLTALLYTDPLEDLTTGLVSPVTHLAHALIDARTRPAPTPTSSRPTPWSRTTSIATSAGCPGSASRPPR
jgi:hypothetical protein